MRSRSARVRPLEAHRPVGPCDQAGHEVAQRRIGDDLGRLGDDFQESPVDIEEKRRLAERQAEGAWRVRRRAGAVNESILCIVGSLCPSCRMRLGRSRDKPLYQLRSRCKRRIGWRNACDFRRFRRRRRGQPPSASKPAALIAAMAACSSWSDVSPETPTAPMIFFAASRMLRHRCDCHPRALIHRAIGGQCSFNVRAPMNIPIWPPGTVFFTMSAFGVPRYFAASRTCSGVVMSSSRACQ